MKAAAIFRALTRVANVFHSLEDMSIHFSSNDRLDSDTGAIAAVYSRNRARDSSQGYTGSDTVLPEQTQSPFSSPERYNLD